MGTTGKVLIRPAWQRYLAAIALTLAVIAGRLALNPWWGAHQNRHLVLLPTVMLAAWFGGLRPGIISAVLSTLALHLWWSSSPGPLYPPSIDVGLFLAFSLVICAVVRSLQVARARADAATRSLERVLEIVAHDLRSPLTAIKALAESIGRANPTLVPRLEKIDRAAVRMDRLIEQLVESTRIGHGELKLAARQEAVRAIVLDTVDLFSTTARDREVALEAGEISTGALVWADRDRIMQVLANLVSNALKFTPPGGRVTLTARPQGGAVEVAVADTGRGIAAADLPHVFEQYWRADERGTGLGLYIARGIVQAHGGRIWADSTPGLGTTFTFTLPVSSGDSERRPALDAAAATPAGAFQPSPPGG